MKSLQSGGGGPVGYATLLCEGSLFGDIFFRFIKSETFPSSFSFSLSFQMEMQLDKERFRWDTPSLPSPSADS